MTDAHMDAKVDAILTECEEVWRRAALDNHWHAGGRALIEGVEGVGKSDCAASIRFKEQHDEAWQTLISVKVGPCALCSAGNWPRNIATLMTHLNDVHRWTWLDFANKFRAEVAAIQRDGVSPPAGRQP